jgi:ClpP class serine protease
MLHNQVLTTILQAPFLIEGQGLQLLYAQVAQLLNGQSGGTDAPEAKELPVQYHAITPHAAALGMMSYNSLDEVPAGSVAVHTVSGVMMPEDTYYSLGTKTLGQRMKQADAHENIVAHVGVFRTPGGSTMGLEDFADTIAGTEKPFVSYLQQACSAGYWSASSGNVMMLAGRTAMCGSIGTMAEFLDFSGFFEKMGIKQVSYNATKSTNKNASFKAAIEGDGKPLQAEILDPLNEVFLSTVQANRAGKLDPKTADKTVLSGMVYVGQANIDNGLADVMGTLDEAIALAAQLATDAAGTTPPDTTSSTHNSMSLFAKKLTLGAAAHALVANQSITPEQATAANAELTAAGVTGVQFITEAAADEFEAQAGLLTLAQASVQATADALAAAGVTDIAALVSQRDAYKVKADKYDKAGGAQHTTPNLEAGATDIDAGEPDANQKAIDELPHNKALDGNPLFAKRVAV